MCRSAADGGRRCSDGSRHRARALFYEFVPPGTPGALPITTSYA